MNDQESGGIDRDKLPEPIEWLEVGWHDGIGREKAVATIHPLTLYEMIRVEGLSPFVKGELDLIFEVMGEMSRAIKRLNLREEIAELPWNALSGRK